MNVFFFYFLDIFLLGVIMKDNARGYFESNFAFKVKVGVSAKFS